MTWSGQFTVEDVRYPDPATVEVVAVAEGDAVTSNTEGKITRAELRLRIDAADTALHVGDPMTASGHFSG